MRHGESVDNRDERLGGDAPLTEKGVRFALELGRYMEKLFYDEKHLSKNMDAFQAFSAEGLPQPDPKRRKNSKGPSGKKASKEPRLEKDPEQIGTSDELIVYTSHLKRAFQTARHIPCYKLVSWYSLGDIDPGICIGLSKQDFKVQMFAEFTARQRDKLNWRYPQGESYVDVKKRLEPVIFEIERERKHMIIVAHQAVLRCLYSYFVDIEESEIPFLPFPLHTVVALKASLAGAHGWEVKEDRIVLDPGAVKESGYNTFV